MMTMNEVNELWAVLSPNGSQVLAVGETIYEAWDRFYAGKQFYAPVIKDENKALIEKDFILKKIEEGYQIKKISAKFFEVNNDKQ